MPDWTHWPFYPSSLSEIIDQDTLKAMESGLSERIGRALTLLEMNPATGQITRRIESQSEKKRYEGLCGSLRERPEGDLLCLEWDKLQANISMQNFQQTGDPFRLFSCHMGLMDMTYIIRVNNRPVAMLFTGQYCPAEGPQAVHNRIDAIGVEEDLNFPVLPTEKPALHMQVRFLTALPENARQQFEQQAEVIQRFAEAEFQLRKRQKEQEFLDQLRRASSGPVVRDRADLSARLHPLLENTRAFLRSRYVVFFGASMEDATVLSPLACSGIPESIHHNLPHFNWRKAGLPVENYSLNNFQLDGWTSDARQKGIRGENREVLADAVQMIPVALGDRYRGVLVFGPFVDSVDLSQEDRFLREVAGTISLFALTSAELIFLEQERSWWHNTARLLTHQYKTGLTPIATDLGWAREIIQKPAKEIEFRQLNNLLARAEDLAMRLAESARETLNGTVSTIKTSDLHFESYQLSALVSNCVNGYINLARQENRELEMDKSVEMLPEAEVDVARLTVAVENLIENAIKYSFAETRIVVRSRIEFTDGPNSMTAVIEVVDQGREVRQSEKDYIFELGTRGSNVLAAVAARSKLSGSGLGLWETRSIVKAHKGKILVSCEPLTNPAFRRERMYNVIFSVYLPLRRTT